MSLLSATSSRGILNIKRLQMKKATGIGGIFFKCEQPKEVAEWYQKHLGINISHGTSGMFESRSADNPDEKTVTVWATFKKDTKYFDPGTKEFMINYRVDDLKELMETLKSEGVQV